MARRRRQIRPGAVGKPNVQPGGGGSPMLVGRGQGGSPRSKVLFYRAVVRARDLVSGGRDVPEATLRRLRAGGFQGDPNSITPEMREQALARWRELAPKAGEYDPAKIGSPDKGERPPRPQTQEDRQRAHEERQRQFERQQRIEQRNAGDVQERRQGRMRDAAEQAIERGRRRRRRGGGRRTRGGIIEG
jgi:hypothetical protein